MMHDRDREKGRVKRNLCVDPSKWRNRSFYQQEAK